MSNYLKINVTEVDYSSYPAIVRFDFIDSHNQVIRVVEKMDILTSKDKVFFPISGFFLKCEIVEETAEGYFIDISKPFGVMSVDDGFLFCVNKDMISSEHFDDNS